MLSLDDAIRHCLDVADYNEQDSKKWKRSADANGDHTYSAWKAKDCLNCAAEHRQLAVWLGELKERRKRDGD